MVIGGGLVYIQIAELPGRLRAALGADAPVRVLLTTARLALAWARTGRDPRRTRGAKRREARPRTAALAALDVAGVVLTSCVTAGATMIFATGMSEPTTRDLGLTKLERLPVNRFLEVQVWMPSMRRGSRQRNDHLGTWPPTSCSHALPMVDSPGTTRYATLRAVPTTVSSSPPPT